MSNLPEIASLWIGGRLSFLEQLCLKSYLDRGHNVTLYSYEHVEGVPEGITLKDAREIYRGAPYRVHILHKSPAIHADFFRVKLMLRGRGEIWVDTDAYCHKAFNFTQPHVYGRLDQGIANGVMRLPADSEALNLYDEFLEAEEPEPMFLPSDVRQSILDARNKNRTVPLEAMPWGVTGPMALTYFLKQTGEDRFALDEKVLYPMNWSTRRWFLKRPQKFMELTTSQTISYHFLGRIVRRILAQEFDGKPKPGSILDQLCKKHEIDPNDAPIIWRAPSGNS